MIREIWEQAVKDLDNREQKIILRKYGIINQPESLSSISKDYGISRERVRQIQQRAVSKIQQKLKDNKQFFKFVDELKGLLTPLGIKKEDIFLRKVQETHSFSKEEAKMVRLLLVISSYLSYSEENHLFSSFFAHEKEIEIAAKHVLKKIYLHFSKNHKNCHPDEVVSYIIQKEIETHLGKKNIDISELIDFLKIIKIIGRNPFGYWGLKDHPEISPKRLKYKLYLILKNEGRPLTSLEILKKLKEIAETKDELLSPHWKKVYNIYSIKNEFLRDERFVILGKSTYGLKEWGLLPGHAFELIFQFIKEKKKTDFQEVWDFISQQRDIKKNSFYIYLNRLKKERKITIEKGQIVYNG